jgi:hypothetical protein
METPEIVWPVYVSKSKARPPRSVLRNAPDAYTYFELLIEAMIR